MATRTPRDNLDFDEQRARTWVAFGEIETMSARTRQSLATANKGGAGAKAVPHATIFQGFIAVAGLLGAGAAIAEVFFS